MEPCCNPKRPHMIQWPDMDWRLLPGRHWFNLGDGEVMSHSFDEEVVVTNWSAQIYWKKMM